MATHIDTIIAEVRNSLSSYSASGLIDDLSIYDWTFKVLRSFGAQLMVKHDTVVQIKDGVGKLPAGFGYLDLAMKCDSGWMESDLQDDVLQSSFFWKERIEKTDSWNGCKTDCDKRTSEKTITEKIYFHGAETRFNYINPTMLKLGKHIKKDYFNSGCKNLYIKESPYEITINETTLYTNFKSGNVFIRYYGLETDEQGKPYVPNTPLNHLEDFLIIHIKRKIFYDMWLNGDEAGIENKLNSLKQEEREQRTLAEKDVKSKDFSIESLLKVQRLNRRKSMSAEYSFPRLW